MRFALGFGLLAAVVSLALPAGRADGLPVAPLPRFAVPVEELKKNLVAALGDSFEFVGAEVGQVEHQSGYWARGRFWFAKVRPKKAGDFALTCTVRFEHPRRGELVNKGRLLVESGEYVYPFRVYERGTARIVGGGAPTPAANVGDTLVIPVCVDQYRTAHTFALSGGAKPADRATTWPTDAEQHKQFLKRGLVKPPVRNDAGEPTELLAAWGQSSVNRPLTELHHHLSAYLELRKAGEFNLAGRLTEADEKTAGDGMALRVVARDQPVTVLLGWLWIREGPSTIDHFPPATVEARVGDRVLLGCGGYVTPAKGDAGPYRPGVVVTRPFKDVKPYTPEPGR